MPFFQSPIIMVLYLTALVLTVLSAGLKKGHIPAYFGCLCFSACIVGNYITGGVTEDILLPALILLALSRLRFGREDKE